MTFLPKLILAMGITTLALSPHLNATAQTWTNGSTDFQWNTTSANWSSSPFVNADSATFGSTGAGTITVASGITASGITINAGGTGYVFTGNTLTNTGTTLANENVEFDNAVAFGTTKVVAGKTITFTGGGSLTPDGIPPGSGGSGTLSFTAGAYTLGNIISQNGGGTVNMIFSGTSTFSSNTTQLAYNNTANLTYSSSGTSAFVNQIRIGRAGTGTLTQTSGTITSSGEVQLDGNGGNGTLDVQGGAFNAGTQQITVQAGQTVGTGLVTVEGGTLTAGTIALNSGVGGTSTVQLTSGTINVNTISSANGGTKSITLSGGTIGANTTTGAWSSDMTLGGNVNIRAALAAGGSANIAISGVLGGTGGFTKTGAGTLTLSNNSNSYSGLTTVSAGTLTTGATGTFGTGNILVNAGSTLTLGNNASIADTASVVFDSTLGTGAKINLNLSGGVETIYALSSISGTTIGPGTYTIAQLNTAFGNLGVDTDVFAGIGSLTIIASAVPEPSTYAAIFSALTLGYTCFLRRRRS
ncbi:MAG TPA: autotransporter-associated beta strand repeat-containing protein [Rariglobus sp.]|jgi:autotransporter-associated beta strand protein|nr:autotransporter-associated beta strand repeat-containing protein [Rariglobus sp.]